MSEQNLASTTSYHVISGRINGERVDSRILEEQVQAAVAQGHRRLQISAYGQHGIGGRLWQAGEDIPLIYTAPSKTLAPRISAPAIKGKSTAVELNDWLELGGVLEAVTAKN